MPLDPVVFAAGFVAGAAIIGTLAVLFRRPANARHAERTARRVAQITHEVDAIERRVRTLRAHQQVKHAEPPMQVCFGSHD